MTEKAFQDYYPECFAHCYGCGSMNGLGHQIKSVWDGEESVCHFQPKSYYTAIPGYVYGGLLASLVDCHGTGTAAAAGYRSENRPMDTEPISLLPCTWIISNPRRWAMYSKSARR